METYGATTEMMDLLANKWSADRVGMVARNLLLMTQGLSTEFGGESMADIMTAEQCLLLCDHASEYGSEFRVGVGFELDGTPYVLVWNADTAPMRGVWFTRCWLEPHHEGGRYFYWES